jgi:restriction system protein
MSIPDYQSLMFPILMASSKGEIHIGAVVNQLADQLGLVPE